MASCVEKKARMGIMRKQNNKQKENQRERLNSNDEMQYPKHQSKLGNEFAEEFSEGAYGAPGKENEMEDEQ